MAPESPDRESVPALLALLTFGLVLPVTGADALDLVGLPFTAMLLAASLLLQLAGLWLLLRRRRLRVGLELGTVAAFVITLAAGLRLAWPALLPVSTSVDEINHYLLVDYLIRHATLPRGDEAASLVEMGQYPFGPHLLIALAARALRIPGYRLLHASAALALASTAAFGYATVRAMLPDGLPARLAALLLVPLMLWPAAYTLGAFTNDFFLAELYGVTWLAAAGYWVTRAAARPGRMPLLGLWASGVGLVFSYPSLLPIFGVGLVLGLVPTRGWRYVGALAAPLLVLAAVYLLPRVGTGLDVVRGGGVATAPSVETLPPLFVLVGAVGLVLATRCCRARPAAWLVWAALAQTALFGLAVGLAGELSSYAVVKMAYVVVPLLAVPGARLLALGLAENRGRLLAAACTAVALVGLVPRLERPVGDRRPAPTLGRDVVAAANFLRDNAMPEPLYLTTNHLSAYWVEIGLLKRPRTADALPRYHDRTRAPGDYWRWTASSDGPSYAVLFDRPDLPGSESADLFRSGGVAVLGRRPEGSPGLLWIGDDLVLADSRVSPPVIASGQSARVDATLGTTAAISEGRQIVARLRDWRGATQPGAAADLAAPSTAALDGGRRLAASVPLATAGLARGAYQVEGLVFRLPSRDALPVRAALGAAPVKEPFPLGRLVVAGADDLRPPDATAARPIGARFGDEIELVGVDALDARPNQLGLQLLWRALRPPSRDYSVFVHVVDGAGKLVAQADGYPWGGALPTSAWIPAFSVPDRYDLAVPPGGPYRVTVGLYRLDTGARLPVGEGDELELGTLGSR